MRNGPLKLGLACRQMCDCTIVPTCGCCAAQAVPGPVQRREAGGEALPAARAGGGGGAGGAGHSHSGRAGRGQHQHHLAAQGQRRRLSSRLLSDPLRFLVGRPSQYAKQYKYIIELPEIGYSTAPCEVMSGVEVGVVAHHRSGTSSRRCNLPRLKFDSITLVTERCKLLVASDRRRIECLVSE